MDYAMVKNLVEAVLIIILLCLTFIIYKKTPLGKLAEIDPRYYEDSRVASLSSAGSLGLALLSMGVFMFLQLASYNIANPLDFVIYLLAIAFTASMTASGVILTSKSLSRLGEVLEELTSIYEKEETK